MPAKGTAFAAIACAMMASTGFAGTVEGSASYRERIAVPPDATLFVELQDVSLADAPAVTLAAQRYALSAVPASFQLSYDDALIKDGHRYSVRATITQGQRLLFTTDTVYPVISDEAGNSVDLMLVQIQAQGATMLENSDWIAASLNGEPIETERRPELIFGQGGAFSGTGGCNRFTGQAEILRQPHRVSRQYGGNPHGLPATFGRDRTRLPENNAERHHLRHTGRCVGPSG